MRSTPRTLICHSNRRLQQKRSRSYALSPRAFTCKCAREQQHQPEGCRRRGPGVCGATEGCAPLVIRYISARCWFRHLMRGAQRLSTPFCRPSAKFPALELMHLKPPTEASGVKILFVCQAAFYSYVPDLKIKQQLLIIFHFLTREFWKKAKHARLT